jgi:hypothetical protein
VENLENSWAPTIKKEQCILFLFCSHNFLCFATFKIIMDNHLLSTVFGRTGDSIWSFLELKDILTLSTGSRFTANLGINSATIDQLVTRSKRNTHLANFKLNFPSELTTGLLRRILNRLNTGVEATICIDNQTGRIILDIGTALNNKDTFLASNVETVGDNDSDTENQEIFKHLEICSYDEYDDFNPRHPKPRENSHRRGDSYFNSDIELVVNELYSSGTGPAGNFDLKSFAAAAAADVDAELGISGKKSAGSDLKSRLLAKKKAAGAAGMGGPLLAPPLAGSGSGSSSSSSSGGIAGGDSGNPSPPRPSSPGCVTRLPYQLRASAELNVDSDDEK